MHGTKNGVIALSENRSDFLHALRWMSAIVVVVGHAQMYHHAVSERWPVPGSFWEYLGVHAHAAVIIFFVLSGFVVAYATERKVIQNQKYGISDYFADRWSRIYSVLLPAVLLTVVLDVVGAYYFVSYSDPELIPQQQYWLRLALNVLGLQGNIVGRVQFGSNPALWSIAYELAFYALWGLFYFRKSLGQRYRIILSGLFIVWLAVFGFGVAWYFLLWLLGVGVWRLMKSEIKIPRMSVWIAIALILARS